MILIGEVKHTMSGIYLITNIINGKVYVGSSVDLLSRYTHHKNRLRKGNHDNPHLQSAWNKYSSKYFSFSILELVSDKDKLIEREQYWIDAFNVCDPNIGYNILPNAGTTLGRKQSDNEREKRKSINTIPFLQFDLEGNLIKEWLSAGEMSRELGVKRSTISAALKNKSKFNKNYYLIPKDEFTDDLLIECLNKKQKKHKGKKINQYDKNGEFIQTWNAIKHASDFLNIDTKTIDYCCKGIYKQAGGFIWSYAD